VKLCLHAFAIPEHHNGHRITRISPFSSQRDVRQEYLGSDLDYSARFGELRTEVIENPWPDPVQNYTAPLGGVGNSATLVLGHELVGDSFQLGLEELPRSVNQAGTLTDVDPFFDRSFGSDTSLSFPLPDEFSKGDTLSSESQTGGFDGLPEQVLMPFGQLPLTHDQPYNQHTPCVPGELFLSPSTIASFPQRSKDNATLPNSSYRPLPPAPHRHQCSSCPRTFTTRHQLSKHTHKMLKCGLDDCDFKSEHSKSVRRHQAQKHRGINYSCDQCSYKGRDDNLKRHKERVHGEDCVK